MDRNSKIIVAICVIGMIANVWWGIKHPPPALPPAPAAQTQPTAAPGAEPKKGDPGVANTYTGGTTISAGALVPEEKIELKSGPVTYTFTNHGGGILKADSHKPDGSLEVTLNARGKAPIGALSREVKKYNDLTYRVVEKTGSHIVFEGETDDHVVVHKDYTLSTAKDANPHLVTFKLTLTNKGTAKHTSDSYYLYTGASASARPDEIVKPSFVWNNAGDAGSVDTNTFHDEPGMFGLSSPVHDIQNSYEDLRWTGTTSRFDAHLLIPINDKLPGKVWSERFLVDHTTDEFKDDSKAKQDYAIHGGAGLPPVALEPNASQSYDYLIYLGPKIYRDLAAIDSGDGHRDLQTRGVMMYGWFSPISRFLVWLMRIFHDWFGNWGAAIILLTCCIRSALWYPQSRSNATMKRMSLLSPKMKELQEKYKDDPQKMNGEVMKLYREYGVNPLGGCLPMFVQIPIFFGFYRVLQSAAELRGQPWFWVQDLSMPDTVTHIMGYPLNVLPLLMGVSMILQMKLTPQPQAADKTQQKIMAFMPLIFLWISYNFASALALYWTAQNLFNIGQSRITKLYQKDPVLAKVKLLPNKPGPSSMSPNPGFGHPNKKKKDKPSPPRPGGGGSSSRGK